MPGDGNTSRTGDVRAVAAMHRHAATVREREVERALSLLGDDLDAETRAAVEELGRRLVAGVLASPTAGLLAGDDDRVETAVELFDGDAETDGGRAREPSTGACAGD